MGGFKSRSSQWLKSESEVLRRAEQAMAQVILYRGTILAPVLSGALADSGRVEQKPGGGTTVTFGGGSVPYALRRHFENKKNPQTLGYLKKAGDSVAKENPKKYITMSK